MTIFSEIMADNSSDVSNMEICHSVTGKMISMISICSACPQPLNQLTLSWYLCHQKQFKH